MIANLDVIERLPQELASRLANDAFFTDIPIVVADEGNVKAMIERKQSMLTTKGGKIGVAVIVLQMIGDDEFTNVAFGPMRLRPAFQVIENRELNLGANGTKKSARKIARQIVKIVKPLRLSGMTTDFECDDPCIAPVNLKEDLGKNLVAYQVNFVCSEADSEVIEMCDMPRLAIVGQTFTLTCSTEGTEIWFTTDESYPDSATAGNAASTSKFYEGPVAIPDGGVTVRAVAYKDGAVASQVNRAVIEPDGEIETAN